jgi:cytochrome P450
MKAKDIHDAAVLETPARPVPRIRGGALFGNLRAFRDDRLGFLARCAREGPVVGFRIANRLFHLVTPPEGVQRVLVDNAANYRKDTRGQELLRDLLGDGILTAQDESWRSQRRLAQPAFQRDRIAGFTDIMVRATREHLDSWEPRARSGEPFDLAAEMSRLTFRIVGLSLFGADLDGFSDEVGRALGIALADRTARATSILDRLLGSHVPTPRNIRWKRAVRALDSVVERTIAERRRRPTADARDLYTLLAQARDDATGEKMSDRLLRDQVLTILLAGHETTANALSWAWALLSTHPAVERRLRAEVESVLGGREPGFEDTANLRYTRAVVDETMRLYPPVWNIARSVVADDRVSGALIPGGSFVFLSPWITHRDPALWPNPEGFDPERFLEPAPGRPRFAYFPFGGGARQCIGNTFALLEATIVLALVVQRYRVELVPGRPLEPEPLITLRPRDGVPVRIRTVRA